MNRILFFLLCLIPVLVPQARGEGIEIYVNGHKFNSFQEYLASKKLAVVTTAPIPVSLNNQQEQYVQQEAQQMGIKVDFSKVKTLQVGPKDISDASMHKLYVLGIENGVVGALRDFYAAWGQSNGQMIHRIFSEQLQEAIQQAVTTSKDPKLLISTPGKVRIMDLSMEKK